MNGEIITDGEMMEAMRHAEILEAALSQQPGLTPALKPTVDFLYRLAWKSQQR